jgi:hypothetical protein
MPVEDSPRSVNWLDMEFINCILPLLARGGQPAWLPTNMEIPPSADLPDTELGRTVRALHPGQRVFGRFSLTKMLGRGGMGVVWEAIDHRLNRGVALKFLPEAVQLDAEAIAELKLETRRALSLTHPGIVRVYDLLESEDAACICMEVVSGRSLAAGKVEKKGSSLNRVGR